MKIAESSTIDWKVYFLFDQKSSQVIFYCFKHIILHLWRAFQNLSQFLKFSVSRVPTSCVFKEQLEDIPDYDYKLLWHGQECYQLFCKLLRWHQNCTPHNVVSLGLSGKQTSYHQNGTLAILVFVQENSSANQDLIDKAISSPSKKQFIILSLKCTNVINQE